MSLCHLSYDTQTSEHTIVLLDERGALSEG